MRFIDINLNQSIDESENLHIIDNKQYLCIYCQCRSKAH